MLVIPLTKQISLRNPPVFTIAIILLNIFVFFILQDKDEQHYKKAETFYFTSGLNKVEIPLYLEFLRNHRPQDFQRITEKNEMSQLSAQHGLYDQLNYDTQFLNLLEIGKIGPDDPLEQQEYLSLRQDYENLQQQIRSLHYGFRPARPRAETWITSMFLHGGFGHLLGNMIFLWLIGSLIEYGCRRWLFLIFYGLGGLAATGFYWLLNTQSLIPAIGASGAISGIMGAFTIFYGFKRVRVFLTLGFYFNYVKFPAIAMLPLWLGNEGFQMLFNAGNGVAYAAHFGGLLGGAAIAAIACRIPNLLDREGFEDAQDDPVQPLVEKALNHMGKLEFSKARALLVSAESYRPDDQVVLKHLYTIDRQDPTTRQFYQTSRRLLALLSIQRETYGEAFRIYREFAKLASPVHLGDNLNVLLCRIFCELEKVEEAHRLLAVLVKKRSIIEEIPTLLLKISELHTSRGNLKARIACLNCICKYYPVSIEAGIAQQQLRTN
jgi:membrane associated rhomboid family serine protease